jgi:hypothetical protein
MNELAIDAYMIYAPYLMFFMRADPLQGQVGGDGALKWQRAKRLSFGSKKAARNGSARIKNIRYRAK